MTERKCTIEDCNGKHLARGYCQKHYQLLRKCGDLPSKSLQDRFEEKVEIREGNSCHWWVAVHTKKGYGLFGVDGIMRQSHRVAYELYKEPIPKGLHVMHKCDNPSCVNPDHLEVGTHQDNMADMVNKGRTCKGEGKANSKLKEGDVIKIRAKASSGNKLVDIAKVYGMSPSTISRVVSGKRWGHI